MSYYFRYVPQKWVQNGPRLRAEIQLVRAPLREMTKVLQMALNAYNLKENNQIYWEKAKKNDILYKYGVKVLQKWSLVKILKNHIFSKTVVMAI